jgi:hypothetical protein
MFLGYSRKVIEPLLDGPQVRLLPIAEGLDLPSHRLCIKALLVKLAVNVIKLHFGILGILPEATELSLYLRPVEGNICWCL